MYKQGSMTLLNYTVFCRAEKKTILPWQIVSVNPPSHTYQSFYDADVKEKCHVDGELCQVHVGRAKDTLDQVDPSLTIADVTSVFGNYVKFTIESFSKQAALVKVCRECPLIYDI